MDNEISVRTAGKVSGFAWGSLSSMASRKQIPPAPYSIGDMMSLLLARRLLDRGLRVGPACEIGFAVQDEWPAVVLADFLEEGQRRRWLAVWPAPAGADCPFAWGIMGSSEKLGDLIEAHGERGLILIDASAIARAVLTSHLLQEAPA